MTDQEDSTSQHKAAPNGSLTERDKVALFIGPNAGRYLELYDATIVNEANQQAKSADAPMAEEQKPGTSPASFNVAAFFVTPFWLFYRKLYLWAFGWTIISATVSYLFDSASLLFDVGWVVWFISTFVAAVFFDNYYIARARKLIRDIETQNLAHEIELDSIRRRGGTSPVSVWMFVVFLMGWSAANFAYGQYVQARTLTDCYNESLNPVTERLVLEELSRRGVEYSTFSVHTGHNGLKPPTDNPRHCVAFSVIDGEDVLFELTITWQNEVGGAKNYQLGDFHESLDRFLKSQEK